MFRALLWKEWRQLALVRWGGIAIGAVLPLAFSAGAELAQRGLLPTGTVKAYASRDLMYELLPAALGFALWPLIGLMSAAQSFAGDRAAGTEVFLLERPVPRGSVWRARLCASFCTLLAVIAATAVLAAVAAALTGAPPGIGWSRWMIVTSAGMGVGLLAYMGGVIAASLLPSPLGAVLLGAVLGGVPVVLAAESMFFLYARIGGVFLGVVVPGILLPAFVAASWLAFCRGEPAGGGRIRRAVTVLGAALACTLGLFVILAPIVVRANAGTGLHVVDPAPSGSGAFVGPFDSGDRGGWIVDVATGAKRAFVPPPIRNIAWRPDGSEVAILTWSGPLGSARPHERIDIRSTGDGRVRCSIPIAAEGFAIALKWADEGLVAIVTRQSSLHSHQLEVETVDPITGAWHRTGFRSQGWSMALVGPGADRRVFVRTLVDENTPVASTAPRGYRFYPVDVAAARVGPAMTDGSGNPLTFGGGRDGLSSSSRFARIVDLDDVWGESRIVDLRAKADQPSTVIPPGARWVSGDRLVWLDDLGHRKRMFVGTPGASPSALREWRDAQVGIEPSPDGHALFVSVLSGSVPASDTTRRPPDAALFEASAPAGVLPEELVYLPDEDRFISLGSPFSDRVNDQRYTQWAGAKTLARIAPGVVYFEDIDAHGKRRFVIGGARDLE